MAECEICGKTVNSVTEIAIDSAEFKACEACRNLGIHIQRAAVSASPALVAKTAYIAKPGPEYTLDPDFSEKIRNARANCKMSQQDLAKALSEKESIVHRLETGRLTPSLSLARKLEMFLNIKLVEFEV